MQLITTPLTRAYHRVYHNKLQQCTQYLPLYLQPAADPTRRRLVPPAGPATTGASNRCRWAGGGCNTRSPRAAPNAGNNQRFYVGVCDSEGLQSTPRERARTDNAYRWYRARRSLHSEEATCDTTTTRYWCARRRARQRSSVGFPTHTEQRKSEGQAAGAAGPPVCLTTPPPPLAGSWQRTLSRGTCRGGTGLAAHATPRLLLPATTSS